MNLSEVKFVSKHKFLHESLRILNLTNNLHRRSFENYVNYFKANYLQIVSFYYSNIQLSLLSSNLQTRLEQTRFIKNKGKLATTSPNALKSYSKYIHSKNFWVCLLSLLYFVPFFDTQIACLFIQLHVIFSLHTKLALTFLRIQVAFQGGSALLGC